MIQLRHMGGALARKSPGAGARATLPGEVTLFALGVAPDDEASQARRRRASPARRRRGAARTARATTRTSSRSPRTRAPSSTLTTWARLREVKALYDPHDLFKGNHHIPPAERPA